MESLNPMIVAFGLYLPWVFSHASPLFQWRPACKTTQEGKVPPITTQYLDFPVFSICKGTERLERETASKAGAAQQGEPSTTTTATKEPRHNPGSKTQTALLPSPPPTGSFVKQCPTSHTIIAVSGGGGGTDYGVPNRLEFYQSLLSSATTPQPSWLPVGQARPQLPLITSQVTTDVIDDIHFNSQRGFFIGGRGSHCVVFRLHSSRRSVEQLLQWQSVHDSQELNAEATRESAKKKRRVIQERCAIDSSGTWVACFGENKTLRVYRLVYSDEANLNRPTQATEVAVFPDLHRANVTDISFSPDGRLLTTVSRDGTISVLSISEGSAADATGSAIHVSTLPLPKKNTSTTPAGAKGHQPSGIPRALRWLPSNSSLQSPDAEANVITYPLLISGYTPKGGSFLRVLTLRSTTLSSSASTQSESGEVQPSIELTWLSNPNEPSAVSVAGCPMFNCINISDDGSRVAAVSNTHVYMYAISPRSFSLRRLFQCPRAQTDGVSSDLPATGCVFTNKDRQLLVGSGDFGLTTIDISRAAAEAALPTQIVAGVKAFWICLVYGLMAYILACCVTGFVNGFRFGPPTDTETLLQRFRFDEPRVTATNSNTLSEALRRAANTPVFPDETGIGSALPDVPAEQCPATSDLVTKQLQFNGVCPATQHLVPPSPPLHAHKLLFSSSTQPSSVTQQAEFNSEL